MQNNDLYDIQGWYPTPDFPVLYIGPTMKNIGQNVVFLSKKKKKKKRKKKNTNIQILPGFGLLKWEMTILT